MIDSASVLQVVHLVVVLWVLYVPTRENSLWATDLLHATFCIGLLVHWVNNNDSCFLTWLEGNLRGIPPQKSFIHRLVSPFYTISDMDMQTIVRWVTLLLALLSIHKFWSKRPYWQPLLDKYMGPREKSDA